MQIKNNKTPSVYKDERSLLSAVPP